MDLKRRYFLQGKIWYCDNLCFRLKLFKVLFIPNELQCVNDCVWINLQICFSLSLTLVSVTFIHIGDFVFETLIKVFSMSYLIVSKASVLKTVVF